MSEQKFKIGDKFYKITRGMLDAMPQIGIDTVTKITQTEKGFEYNDRIKERYMWTSLEKAKEEVGKRIDDEYARAKSAVNTYADRLYSER